MRFESFTSIRVPVTAVFLATALALRAEEGDEVYRSPPHSPLSAPLQPPELTRMGTRSIDNPAIDTYSAWALDVFATRRIRRGHRGLRPGRRDWRLLKTPTAALTGL